MLLLLTRKVLHATDAHPDPVQRSRTAALFLGESRTIIEQLRLLEFGHDPGFNLIVARLRERLILLRAEFVSLLDPLATLQLWDAELHALSGDLSAALMALEPAMQSIGMIQSRDLRDEIAVRYFEICVGRMEGRVGCLALLSYLARRSRHGRVGLRFGRALHLMANQAEVLRESGRPLTALTIRAWARLVRMPPWRLTLPVATIAIEQLGLRIIRWECRTPAARRTQPRVVRAMGGIGDLLMMTPGLRALSKRIGKPVEFAVPRRYFELFEGNPFVTALALEDLAPDWFNGGRIIDLTDCPASIVESRTAPRVTKNRIELFARALGVGKRELHQHGSVPVFEPTPAARRAVSEWLAARHLRSGEFIAIQASAAEGYRTWNGMADVARALAKLRPVVVFDDKPSAVTRSLSASHENIDLAVGLRLSIGLALACEARLIVAPDSAFLHLAAARGIPCVGVFGPTDGAVRTSSYARAVVVSRSGLPCSPCWRNQATPCILSGGMRSVCLESLPSRDVIDAARRLLE